MSLPDAYRSKYPGAVAWPKKGSAEATVLILRQNCRRLAELAGTGARVMLVFPECVRGLEREYTQRVPGISEAKPYIDKAVAALGSMRLKNTFSYDYAKPPGFSTDYRGVKPLFARRKARPKASVIILTCNRKPYLMKSLSALAGQTEKGFEVIVVDDGSEDGTGEAAAAESYPFAITYLYWSRTHALVPGTPTNRAGPARNLGAEFARGRLLIFIDSDIVPGPAFVAEHLKAAKAKRLVIGPSVREREQKDVREKYFLMCTDDIMKLPTPWAMAHSGNLSVMRHGFRKLGGFDHDFVHWGMEDDELGFRAISRGFEIYLAKDAQGMHLWHEPEHVSPQLKHQGDVYNAEVFYKKHLDPGIYDYHLDWRAPQKMERFSTVRLSCGCNNNCAFCSFLSMKKRRHSAGEVREIVHGAKSSRRRLIISGGEPTLSGDFWSVLEMAGGTETELVTNARAFSIPGYAARAAGFGLKNALVCIFGSRPEVHDRITKAAGSFSQAINGIRALQRQGVGVAAHIVVNAVNFSDFDATVAMLQKMGISSLHLTVVPPGEPGSGRFAQDDFYAFVRKVQAMDIRRRNEFFTCLEQGQHNGLGSTADMKKCLSCCFVGGCRGAAGARQVFFRDDDVGMLTPSLRRLVDFFTGRGIPLNLQVIPKSLTPGCAAYLKKKMKSHPGLIFVSQHGYRHTGYGKNKHEFGPMRTYRQQLSDMRAGMRIMDRKFCSWTRVFTPPYNVHDSNTVKAAKKLGFLAVSSGMPVTGIADLSVNTDLIRDYATNERAGFSEIRASAGRHSPSGILLHHDRMQECDYRTLEQLIRELGPGFEFVSFEKLISPQVLFVHPRFRHKSALLCEPTGLLSLAGALEQRFQTAIIDMNLPGNNDFRLLAAAADAKYVCITAVTVQMNEACRLSTLLRWKYPEKTVIFGGVHPTFMPEEAFEKAEASYVIIGEGEAALPMLIGCLEQGRMPAVPTAPAAPAAPAVPGVVFMQNGKVHVTKPQPVCDLDSLPMPAYHLVPIGMYRTSECMVPGARRKAVHIMTSRGCPNNCTYCASPALYNRRVRYRSVAGVVDEIKYLSKWFGIEWVHLHDDNFLLAPDRVREFCDRILALGRRIEWTCLANVRAVSASPELLPVMKEAGCIGIEMGIETGDSAALARLKQTHTLDDARAACRLIRRAGIPAMYLMMCYCPGENVDSPRKSLLFLAELHTGRRRLEPALLRGMHLMGHLARASPGSEFYRTAPKEGMVLTKSWDDHFEENIGFLPDSFLDDVPVRAGLSRAEALKLIRTQEKLIRFCADSCYYISSHMLGAQDLESFMEYMADVYASCSGTKVRNLPAGPVRAAMAVAMLSVIGLVSSQA